MPLPQWMQNAGSAWKKGGGIGGLMANPYFQMGQSVGAGRSPTQGYLQSQQVQQLAIEQAQRQELERLLGGITQQTGGILGPQQQGPQPQQAPNIAEQSASPYTGNSLGDLSTSLGLPQQQQARPTTVPTPQQRPGMQGPMVSPNARSASPQGVQALPAPGALPQAPGPQQQTVPPPMPGQPQQNPYRQAQAPQSTHRKILEAFKQAGNPEQKLQAAQALNQLDMQEPPIKPDRHGVPRYVNSGKRVYPNVGPAGERDIKHLQFENELRKDFRKVEAKFETSFQSAKKVFAFLDLETGTGDYGALIATIKSLDPESTVREGEADMMQSFQSYKTILDGYIERADAEGGKIPDTMREQMREMVGAMTAINKARYDNVRSEFERQISTDSGIVNPRNVMSAPIHLPDKLWKKWADVTVKAI